MYKVFIFVFLSSFALASPRPPIRSFIQRPKPFQPVCVKKSISSQSVYLSDLPPSHEMLRTVGFDNVTITYPDVISNVEGLEMYFSPNGGAEEAIVRHIQKCKSSIFVAAYTFTSKPILNALISAARMGIDVRVLLDKSQLRGLGSAADALLEAEILTWVDCRHAIFHNKVIIYDMLIASSGSLNLSDGANTKNAENLIFLPFKFVCARYKSDWDLHRAHSVSLTKDLLLKKPRTRRKMITPATQE